MDDQRRTHPVETFLTGGWRMFHRGPGKELKLTETGIPAKARCLAFAPRWDAVEGDLSRTQRFWDRWAGHLRADSHVLYDHDAGWAWAEAEIELEVMPDGEPPYAWRGTTWVPLKALKPDRLPDPVGMTLPVYFDPADDQRVAVDWLAARHAAKKRRRRGWRRRRG